MTVPVKIGGKVPLCLVIHDRQPGLFVRAKIYDKAGTLEDTIDLAEIFPTVHVDCNFDMSKQYYKALFDVYLDSGRTELACYAQEAEIFVDSLESKLNTILNTIQNVTGSLASIEGTIGTDALDCDIDAGAVDCDIEQKVIEGGIGAATLEGGIDDDDIEGNIGCK